MEQNDETVKVVRVEADGKTKIKGSEREMTKTQFAYIGDDPATNGGWQLVSPKESIADPELIAARARYEELYPAEKAGKKSLETLNEAIAKASHPNE